MNNGFNKTPDDVDVASDNGTVNRKPATFQSWSQSGLTVLIFSLLLVFAAAQDCPNLPNTDKTPAVNGQCACLGIAYWDPVQIGCFVDCTALQNADTTQVTNAISCTCKSGYTWSAPDLNCVASCATDPYASSPTPNVDGVCDCKTQFAFDPATAQCEITCSMIPYALDKISVDTCTCNDSPPIFWSATSFTCVLDCSKAPNTVNSVVTNGACNCLNAYKWNPLTANCDVDCNAIQHTDLSGYSDATTCTCGANYFWVKVGAYCGFDCSTVGPYYSFSTSTFSCVWDCKLVAHSNGVTTANGICVCETGYTWSQSSTSCQVQTLFDCSKVANVNVIASTGLPNGVCVCNVPYTWVQASQSCVCTKPFKHDDDSNQCAIDCDRYEGCNRIRYNYRQCQCKRKYIWNNVAPYGCNLDCSQISNTNGVPSTNNLTCTCQSNYVWVPSTLECILNCALDPLSTGNVVWGKCTCRQGASFNYITNKCALQCYAIPNTNGRQPVNNACTCISSSYTWNAATLKCVLNCANVLHSNLQPAINGKCTCQSGYSWKSYTATCTRWY